MQKSLTVIFDDDRYQYMIYKFLAYGYFVNVVGGPKLNHHAKLYAYKTLNQTPPNQEAIILPLRGITERRTVINRWDNSEYLVDSSFWDVNTKQTLLFTVVQKTNLGLNNLYILNNNDSYANKNAVLTAEGTLYSLMKVSNSALRDRNCYILGYGRCGIALARVLTALNVKVTVVARRDASRAQAWRDGFHSISYHEFDEVLSNAEIIINTVPALLLDSTRLREINKDTIILDIASNPGGTDFKVAKELGIKAILLPGIPGKYAPVTAGEIMADVINNVLIERRSVK